MRLWRCVSAVAVAPLTALAAQLPFELSLNTSSVTLVDALSADPDYTSLLSLLQRARLIPTLNRLNGSTLFAPTNDAIERHSQHNSLWRNAFAHSNADLLDNVQEQLRQQLFYHLINYSVSAVPDDQDIITLKTLHYPHAPKEPPSRDPPPYPPWMPIPGGTLGGEPQRLRIAERGAKLYVGVDARGKKGAQIVKGKVDAGNGILLGIDDVLEPPANLATVISQHSSLSYFNQVLTPEITELLNTAASMSVFLPVNEAWDSLNKYEKLYLESGFAADDLKRILGMHAVVEKAVHWSDTFAPALNLTTLEDTQLEIVVAPEKTMVSGAELVKSDIYASNGVLHLVSDILVPEGSLKITPEKYLLGLNCSSFVSLIHASNLTSLVNDTAEHITILAPPDDVFAPFLDGELPPPGSDEMARILKYHFLPGRWSTDDLRDGMLLETYLDEAGLEGHHQVLDIEVSQSDKDKASKDVRFGGVGLMRDPVLADDKTTIYFLSRPLVPPSDILDTILPHLDMSSFLAALYSTSLADILKTTPRTSLLVPSNDAFKSLLLVSDHLLSPAGKQDLGKVLMHHALDSIQYADPLASGSQHSFATLEGSDIQLDRGDNGTLTVSSSGGWPGMHAALHPQDLLTQTGVIHEVSDILIPRSIDITVNKLVKAGKGSTMATILGKTGMDWILNGTAPPEGSPWDNEIYKGASWTLLFPKDDAFKGLNLTELYSDVDRLRTVVNQHLIPIPPANSQSPFVRSKEMTPADNRPIAMGDDATYSTVHSLSSAYGDVIFKQQEDSPGRSGLVVGIKGARGTDGESDWANVMSWGRVTTGGGTGGVVQIDRLLVPYQPAWWVEYGGPTLVGVVGIILICGFFYGINILWRKESTEATYEPIGGFGRDDEA